MTVGQINEMPIEEYLGWQEFYLLEPWGIQVQDTMHAHSISVLAEINRNRTERPEPYRIKDFTLYDDRVPEKKAVDPLVGGKTCEEWQLLFAAEALAARCQVANE
ncbi:phage tail assembly protein T [Undibacterium sp. MH2W]|uniref:phage tail assembly protein T n=1 Tax=Undibacterium sp. MH2W TaxID=3413044 RepID=UPI003BF241D8